VYSSVVCDDDEGELRFSKDRRALPKRRVNSAQRSFLPTTVKEDSEAMEYSELTRKPLMTSDSV
jgi:hypothetical protein